MLSLFLIQMILQTPAYKNIKKNGVEPIVKSNKINFISENENENESSDLDKKKTKKQKKI